MPSTNMRDQEFAAIAAQAYRAAEPVLNQGRTEIVFIESNVIDYQILLDGLRPGVEVHLLDAEQDGLQQSRLSCKGVAALMRCISFPMVQRAQCN